MNRRRIALFPLPGAILFPGMQLPLHIFEPRYRAMVSEVMARDQRIGMIQPRGGGDPPPLFDIGCVGHIVDITALEDGRFNIVLEGEARFTLSRELEVGTPFRQAEVDFWDEGEEDEPLAAVRRAALEDGAKMLAERFGYQVDWDMAAQIDDYHFVNACAQLSPFDAAAKQALLEVSGLSNRADMLIQMMQFFGRRDAGEDRATLQ